MRMTFTLEYWIVDAKFVGRLREIPSISAREDTLEALEKAIRDAYFVMLEDQTVTLSRATKLKEIYFDI